MRKLHFDSPLHVYFGAHALYFVLTTKLTSGASILQTRGLITIMIESTYYRPASRRSLPLRHFMSRRISPPPTADASPPVGEHGARDHLIACEIGVELHHAAATAPGPSRPADRKRCRRKGLRPAAWSPMRNPPDVDREETRVSNGQVAPDVEPRRTSFVRNELAEVDRATPAHGAFRRDMAGKNDIDRPQIKAATAPRRSLWSPRRTTAKMLQPRRIAPRPDEQNRSKKPPNPATAAQLVQGRRGVNSNVATPVDKESFKSVWENKQIIYISNPGRLGSALAITGRTALFPFETASGEMLKHRQSA